MPWRLLSPAILLLTQTCPDVCPTSSPELLWIFTPDLRGLHICGTFVVWTAQHTDNAHEDRFGRLHWRPTLRGVLVSKGIVDGGMQNRDTDFAGRVDYGGEKVGQLGDGDGSGREDGRRGGGP